MQSIKANITRLKTKLIENLPDDNDLYGYQGVNKTGLLELLDRAHGHVARLEELDLDVAMVMLKRKLSYLLVNAKQYLDDHVGTDQAKEKFNRFLEDLTSIHDNVVLTYYIFADRTIRDQAQIDSVLSQINGYEEQITQLSSEINECVQRVAEAESKFSAIGNAEESIQLSLKTIADDSGEIETIKSNVTAAREVIYQYRTDIKQIVESVHSASGRLTSNEKRASKLLTDALKAKDEIDKLILDAKDAHTVNMRQLNEIQRTVSEASKYGMAASFKTRKDELGSPIITWGIIFFLSIIALLVFSVYYVIPDIPAGRDFSELSAISILFKLVVVAPLVWMGWMSAKQYSFLSRIREDYSYKYASALAFEGYKKEAIDVDSEMAKDLLKVAIVNLSLNPLRIYEASEDNHSPISELMGKIFGRGKSENKT